MGFAQLKHDRLGEEVGEERLSHRLVAQPWIGTGGANCTAQSVGP